VTSLPALQFVRYEGLFNQWRESFPSPPLAARNRPTRYQHLKFAGLSRARTRVDKIQVFDLSPFGPRGYRRSNVIFARLRLSSFHGNSLLLRLPLSHSPTSLNLGHIARRDAHFLPSRAHTHVSTQLDKRRYRALRVSPSASLALGKACLNPTISFPPLWQFAASGRRGRRPARSLPPVFHVSAGPPSAVFRRTTQTHTRSKPSNEAGTEAGKRRGRQIKRALASVLMVERAAFMAVAPSCQASLKRSRVRN
jgi:hypothetical protein